MLFPDDLSFVSQLCGEAPQPQACCEPQLGLSHLEMGLHGPLTAMKNSLAEASEASLTARKTRSRERCGANVTTEKKDREKGRRKRKKEKEGGVLYISSRKSLQLLCGYHWIMFKA